MEDHKILFKSQSIALSPRNHNKINRELQRVARMKNREECFQSNRVIDVSPTPNKIFPDMLEKQHPSTANGEQENQNPQMPAVNETLESTKENYLQRYIKWKAKNKQRAPPARGQKIQQSQAAAEVFVPPKRQSIYVVIDPKTSKTTEISRLPAASQSTKSIALEQPPATKYTPGVARKPTHGVATKPTPGVTRKPTAGLATKTTPGVTTKPTPGVAARTTPGVTTKPTPGVAIKHKPVTTVKPKPVAPTAIAKKPAQLPTAKHVSVTAAGAVTRQKTTTVVKKPWQLSTAIKPVHVAGPVSTATAAASQKPSASAHKPVPTKLQPTPAPRATRPVNLMTQPFDKPANVAKIVKPIRAGGAAGKFKTTLPQKQTKSQPMSDLVTRMKVKKTAPVNSKQKLVERMPELKKELLDIATEEQLPETPVDLASIENPFQAQATSTQCRSSNNSQDLLEVFRNITKLSPVSINESPKNTVSSVKRQLISEESSDKLKNKFNFVRYSEGYSILESPAAEEPDTVIPATTVEDKTVVPQTPPQGSNSRPNYMSPFVSVSRGKVNSQTERQKRNSMYLQDEGKDQAETPVAVRRTLESVQYFRLQLEDEIKRLHSLCDEWSSYCDQNEERLTETGGKDMIDAAIGQTKLLTSKKLMQFGSLIDRCESGATGIGLRPNDGSEATKPVLAEDLEGWWDMMRLQSDNVDKRFSNLGRWRANDWQDPDVVAKPKPKAKGAPKAKAKLTAKASSNLMSFLRKAKAEKRKNQNEEGQLEQSTQQNNTPTRRIIVVRDRKSFSPARTVLRLSIGSGGRPSIGAGGRTSIGGGARSSIGGGGRPSTAGNCLLKSAIMGAAEQKSRQHTPPQTPTTAKRMSILKTPGTKKRESGIRGVIFSAKKNVRRFEFTVEEGNISGDEENELGIDKLEDCEEDMSLERSSSNSQTSNEIQGTPENPNLLRTVQLRNRRVKIRPSSEFM